MFSFCCYDSLLLLLHGSTSTTTGRRSPGGHCLTSPAHYLCSSTSPGHYLCSSDPYHCHLHRLHDKECPRPMHPWSPCPWSPYSSFSPPSPDGGPWSPSHLRPLLTEPLPAPSACPGMPHGPCMHMMPHSFSCRSRPSPGQSTSGVLGKEADGNSSTLPSVRAHGIPLFACHGHNSDEAPPRPMGAWDRGACHVRF